eukprot:7391427-Prymnesium_polylepis.4
MWAAEWAAGTSTPHSNRFAAPNVIEKMLLIFSTSWKLPELASLSIPTLDRVSMYSDGKCFAFSLTLSMTTAGCSIHRANNAKAHAKHGAINQKYTSMRR